jgi:putative endonuclease
MVNNSRQIFGQRAELAAAGFLSSRGYTILEQNYTTRYGEIDIVACHEDTLVFVEVKARRSLRHGGPKEAVNASKQKKIIGTATHYIKQHSLHDTRIRFDVVAMLEENGHFSFELIPNAFQVN